jgi:hypothetical protein
MVGRSMSYMGAFTQSDPLDDPTTPAVKQAACHVDLERIGFA